jgi:hypothetical protein
LVLAQIEALEKFVVSNYSGMRCLAKRSKV